MKLISKLAFDAPSKPGVAEVDGDIWEARCSSYVAVFTKTHPSTAATRAVDARLTTEAFATFARGCLTSSATEVPRSALWSFVSPECDACKGLRLQACEDCQGSGKATYECPHCKDTHVCTCACGGKPLFCHNCSRSERPVGFDFGDVLLPVVDRRLIEWAIRCHVPRKAKTVGVARAPIPSPSGHATGMHGLIVRWSESALLYVMPLRDVFHPGATPLFSVSRLASAG